MSFTFRARILASLFTLSTAVCFQNIAAGSIATAGTGEESDFLPAIEMAPFVVEGDNSAIFVHARSRGDRRYDEKFAEEVIRVTYDSLGKSTGRGLVIVGRNKEPHPFTIFEKFIAMADAGQLDPSVMPMAEATRKKLVDWQEEIEIEDAEMGIEFDMVVELLPISLEASGSKLYQWAWIDEFDMELVDQRFRNLRAEDFSADQLDTYDWVFYLPPKGAVHRVIKEVIPLVMKAEDMGFFARAAARTALIAFRPVITKAMEGMRKGMLFYAVSKARTAYSKDDIEQLAQAYSQVLMPDFKFNGGSQHARAVEAIQQQLEKNIEYAKDPFIAPERSMTLNAADYADFPGDYVDEDQDEVTHRFRIEDDTFTWTYRDKDPMVFYAATSHKLIRENGKMTIEFLIDEDGNITGVEERWHRRRKTVPVQSTTLLTGN